MKAVIRADASQKIGGGHIMRCLTLADILSENGWQCSFAVNHETIETVPLLKASQHHILLLNTEFKNETELIKQHIDSCNWMIVDHYGLDREFQEQAREFSENILVIDDLANRAHDCDILLDQTHGRKEYDYKNVLPKKTKLLLGSNYALLRPDFAKLRATAKNKRSNHSNLKRILVSMGASDPHGINVKILKVIQKENLDLIIDVAIGNGDPKKMGLTQIADHMKQEVKFHSFKSNIAKLMLDADLAIGAAGSTSWERCCLGLPTLMIITAENQQKIANELTRIGAVECLCHVTEFDEKLLIDKLKYFANNPELLVKMANSAFQIGNGKGALNVFLEMCLVKQNKYEIRLQPTKFNDSEALFKWQQDPSTRKLFRNPKIPIRKEHDKWFALKQEDPNCIMLSILKNKKISGIIRLDKTNKNNEYEVSIVIAPEMQGQGIGKEALTICNDLFKNHNHIAEIHPDNNASKTIFLNSGFKHNHGNYFIRAASI